MGEVWIGLDFETHGSRSLPDVGLVNYVEDPAFRVLLAAVSYTDRPTLLIDFSKDYDHALSVLYGQVVLPSFKIVAHNAGFERAVLKAMGYNLPAERFIDSAVLARSQGYGGSLEAAAPQMLGTDKLESGRELIRLFSIPTDERLAGGHPEWDETLPEMHPDEWAEFGRYCMLDAELSLEIARQAMRHVPGKELEFMALTMEMNGTGWPVDTELVRALSAQHTLNTESLLGEFADKAGKDTNINSHKQMVEWCNERGVRASSFDEKSVKRMVDRIEKRLKTQPDMPPKTRINLIEVLQMLQIKQELGGSSPKKLDVLQRTVAEDGRLYDNYMHIGAGATWRTTGRGVQMQNLPRLHGYGDDVDQFLVDGGWSNGTIAANLRQVFRARHPQGRLIVGDFSSIESRGLAWQANEQWKLDAYRQGKDLYKELAAKFFHRSPEDIGPEDRTFGKVGELSCGYGAGPDAVQSFAANMGIVLSNEEAADLVRDWRRVNETTEAYWYQLDRALHAAIAGTELVRVNTEHMAVGMWTELAPRSLRVQTGQPGLQSLRYEMSVPGLDGPLLSRVIHGVQGHGRNIRYWKPSERKTGDLWKDTFVDPKTGERRWFSLYGGKMAGLLTQSLCRELFFWVLTDLNRKLVSVGNVQIIGQFHDEIVLEWQPAAFEGREYLNSLDLAEAEALLRSAMTMQQLKGFPMAAEIKSARRYTK